MFAIFIHTKLFIENQRLSEVDTIESQNTHFYHQEGPVEVVELLLLGRGRKDSICPTHKYAPAVHVFYLLHNV